MAGRNSRSKISCFSCSLPRPPGSRALTALLGGLCIAVGAQPIRAQNVIQNSYFDSDANAWLTTEGAQWSHSLNLMRDENDHGGALHVLVNDRIQSAEQCVPLEAGSAYVFETYALRDFTSSGYPDPERAGWFYSIQFRDGTGCDDNNSNALGTLFNYSEQYDFGWQRQYRPILSVKGNHALIAIGTDMAATSSPVYYYFDAVTLTRDTVFKWNFE